MKQNYPVTKIVQKTLTMPPTLTYHPYLNGRSNYRIGPHQTSSEFHSLPHWTKFDYIGHSQYHI